MTINVWKLGSAENDNGNIFSTGVLVQFCISYSCYPAFELIFFKFNSNLNFIAD